MSRSPKTQHKRIELDITGDYGGPPSRGLTIDAAHAHDEYLSEANLKPGEKELLTEADALPLSEVVRQEYPSGVTMNSEEDKLYQDEYDALNFEQDRFDPHKGGKGRSKGQIAENHRPDPSGPTRKIVANWTNNAKNQRQSHPIQHHSANHNAAVAAEAQAEALASKELAASAPIKKKGGNGNHRDESGAQD